jgi:hypothetical protein
VGGLDDETGATQSVADYSQASGGGSVFCLRARRSRRRAWLWRYRGRCSIAVETTHRRMATPRHWRTSRQWHPAFQESGHAANNSLRPRLHSRPRLQPYLSATPGDRRHARLKAGHATRRNPLDGDSLIDATRRQWHQTPIGNGVPQV